MTTQQEIINQSMLDEIQRLSYQLLDLEFRVTLMDSYINLSGADKGKAVKIMQEKYPQANISLREPVKPVTINDDEYDAW